MANADVLARFNRRHRRCSGAVRVELNIVTPVRGHMISVVVLMVMTDTKGQVLGLLRQGVRWQRNRLQHKQSSQTDTPKHSHVNYFTFFKWHICSKGTVHA